MIALLLAVFLLGALAAPGDASTILDGMPHYDPLLHVLVVPYRGSAPRLAYGTGFADSHLTLDVDDASTPFLAQAVPVFGDAVLRRATVAPGARRGVRITLEVADTARVRATVDTRRKVFYLSLERPALFAASRPGAWGGGAVSADPDELAIKVRSNRISTLDVHTDAATHTYDLSLRVGARRLPSPEVPFVVPTPRVVYVERSPSPGLPVATPTPTISVLVQTLAPTPVPLIAQTPPPAAVSPLGGGLTYFLANYQEVYAPGTVNTSVDANSTFGLTLSSAWPQDWLERLSLATLTYGFSDAFLPLSVHQRQEAIGDLAISRRFAVGPLRLEGGAGYLGRYETATHSGAPPSPSYAFSPYRITHGPELTARVEWLPGWGLGVYASGAFAPYLFSSLPAGITPLPTLLETRLEGGLSADVGPVRLAIAYQRWQTTGTDYNELFSGPTVSLALRPTSP